MSPPQSPSLTLPPPPPGSEEYWLEYWKNVFSHDVLGYSDPSLNVTRGQNNWWKYQSAPWVAIVTNFEHKARWYWKKQYDGTIQDLKEITYTEDEYCRCCGEQSKSWYCEYCEADRCTSCGEIGCGSYMCLPCRQLNRR